MSDRDMLEWAAKSVGMKVGIEADEWFYSEWGDNSGMFLTGALHQRWNPLRDDGDALRLAVRLGIDVLHESLDESPHIPTHVKAQSWSLEAAASEALWEDPYAATRRAIVRAAAEIGKGMA